MVIGLIILGICILLSIVLICFKGITVTYHKDFTVNDERMQQPTLTEQQLKTLEKDLNNTPKPKIKEAPEDLDPTVGPMDHVIAEIQELFGPEKDED